MSRKSRATLRTATLLATFAIAPAVPAVAQQSQAATPAVTPRQIAANAHAALLMVHAMNGRGDTLGVGTGFVVSADGLFVTNYHVIEEAERLVVTLLDGGKYDQVQLVSADPASDLALMKLPATGLRPLPMGSDARMEVGDKIYTMGNPLGMSGTFSDGMVSGKRPLEGVHMLQISAPISPGSSGGPVMNERGEVIGVATIMVMGGQNLNLAVPVRYLQPMLAQRADPRPFSPAVLVSNPQAGLALVGDHGGPPRLGGRRGGAPARRDPAREVESQLHVLEPMLQMRGYVSAYPVQTGTAQKADGESHEFTLEKGVSYLVTARCDAMCDNVDVGVYDGDGTLLEEDSDRDDYPTVSITPAQSGSYRVTVKVAQCTSEPCTYGVAVFRRQPVERHAKAAGGQ
ncbi:MAG TPA: S1C family serine protease [Longimicrobium sp.]|nr:S1C family serine protease [Longimicrobium sp.]